MPLENGDVVAFDYELWVEGQETLHDTTLREAAERAGVLDPQAHYGPVSYVLGSGRLVPGLERALREASAGTTQDVELGPGDAYGERDPKLVETLPMAEFRKNEVDPQLGLVLSVRNRRGVVTTVGGGRVRVDFNAPLAGKRLRYRFTVRRIVQDDAGRIEGILRMNFPLAVEWKVRTAKEGVAAVAIVDVPQDALLHRDWLVAKFRTLTDVRRWTKVERVRYVEEYPLRPSEAEAEVSPSNTA